MAGEQEYVTQARQNSAEYRQKLVEWEKKVLADGHPELVRRVHVKKASATPRVRSVKPKAKPATKRARAKPAAAKPKARVKNASTQTAASSKGKVAAPKVAASRKKTRPVEE